MKQQNTLFRFSVFLTLMSLFVGCKKNSEVLQVAESSTRLKAQVEGIDDYYSALRAYKKSDHAISFGWAGGSILYENPPTPTWKPRLDELPDSLDVVSLWGDGGGFWVAPAPSETFRFEQLQKVRRDKGTKFVACAWGYQVVDLMKQKYPALYKDNIMVAIDSAAKWIADYVEYHQIDGFDLDYEPDYGDRTIFGDDRGRGVSGYTTDDPHTQRLFKALSKYMGPLSGTDKILMIDGQFDLGIEPYVNYLAQQAYGASNSSVLQGRFNNFGGGVLPSKKFIVTENTQAYGPDGVDYWANGVNIGSVLGMASWNPTQGRKGGFGTYMIDYDANLNSSGQRYSFLRAGIQIQNPANVSGGTPNTAGVVFYQNSNFEGTASQTLTKGNYTMAQLQAKGVLNDWASSVKIPNGWTVVIYEHGDFSGNSWTLNATNSWLGALSPSANDKLSSVKIQ